MFLKFLCGKKSKSEPKLSISEFDNYSNELNFDVNLENL